MQLKDLTEEQKNQIHDQMVGTSKFDWGIVNEVLELDDASDFFDDCEIMDACDLEFCEMCEWVMSRNECGEHPDLDFVCLECSASIDNE